MKFGIHPRLIPNMKRVRTDKYTQPGDLIRQLLSSRLESGLQEERIKK
jgi:hypothetical protein